MSGQLGNVKGARVRLRETVGDWRGVYGRRLALTDLLVLVWVVFGTQIAWLGIAPSAANLGASDRSASNLRYSLISLAIIAGWMLTLAAYGSRADRVVGAGAAEYKLVFDSSVTLFGIVAIVAFLFKLDLARGYILIAFPLGVIVLIFARWMWRQWLGVQRRRGEYSSRVLLVGSEVSTAHIARELGRLPQAGYRVVGACVPDGLSTEFLSGTRVPVYGSIDTVAQALAETGADTVIITSSDELSPARVRKLSWGLEQGRQHLVVAPSLTDIGGPRIHTRPVAGLPLIHVETPRYDGKKWFAKRTFDVVGSASLIVMLSAPLAVLALIVKFTSAGPVLYRQERIGRKGEPFHMLKFRSMIVNADAQLATLLAEQGRSDQPLFKVHDDPRITRIGRVLRKYSLDEFPQLFNVFRGDMSLVGPRPQRQGEVALYDDAARRRLIVQPGMTGLWQVSGRSALSWEDAIRLDLYYVENWSISADIGILWRTFKAIVAPGDEAT